MRVLFTNGMIAADFLGPTSTGLDMPSPNAPCEWRSDSRKMTVAIDGHTASEPRRPASGLQHRGWKALG